MSHPPEIYKLRYDGTDPATTLLNRMIGIFLRRNRNNYYGIDCRFVDSEGNKVCMSIWEPNVQQPPYAILATTGIDPVTFILAFNEKTQQSWQIAATGEPGVTFYRIKSE